MRSVTGTPREQLAILKTTLPKTTLKIMLEILLAKIFGEMSKDGVGRMRLNVSRECIRQTSRTEGETGGMNTERREVGMGSSATGHTTRQRQALGFVKGREWRVEQRRAAKLGGLFFMQRRKTRY